MQAPAQRLENDCSDGEPEGSVWERGVVEGGPPDGRGCAEFYAWLVKEGVVKVVDEVEDGAKDLWEKVTGWF